MLRRTIDPSSHWQALRHIPTWYHSGMSRQIAVRLPDDVVERVDGLVSEGTVSSRAELDARALDRARRNATGARDAEILARAEPDSDMDRLAEHAAGLPLPLR